MARPAEDYRGARRNRVIRQNGMVWPPAYQDANANTGRARRIKAWRYEDRRDARRAAREEQRSAFLTLQASVGATMAKAFALLKRNDFLRRRRAA